MILLTIVALLAADTIMAAPVMRRLTHSQYNNTVRDLLGDQTRPADQFPQEDFTNGFKNQSAAQDIPPLLAEAYDAAAEKLAERAFQSGQDVNHLIPCKPRSVSDAACRNRFIREFGLKAFRRPLTIAEANRYSTVFAKEARRTGKFLNGAQLVVEAMLQSPKFLFRIEQGGSRRGHQIAGRLSYFLWDTMPDRELFRAAGAGELNTEPGVEKAVARMLGDERAKEALDEFISQWLRFDLVLNTVKDRTLFPQFTPELATAMTEETLRLIADVVWNDRSFMEIFEADYGFLNSDLAALYGMPAPAGEFEKVRFPAGSERAGLTGQAMFLALTSKPGETSPTVRGYYVREHFLCFQVPDPPPGTNSNLPPLRVDMPQTNRERLKDHLERQCAGCHSLMDPIGFGLEKFDVIGRRREKQLVTFFSDRRDRESKGKVVELPLDVSGTVSGLKDGNFTSPKGLGQILARSPQCQDCIVKQFFRYAFGRRETDADKSLLDKASNRFRASEFRLKELLSFLAKSLSSYDSPIRAENP
jgi:hypothetical protein